MYELSAERFETLATLLTSQIRHVVPGTTLHIDEEAHAYCCVSWRLNGCGERELFVEQPGSAIAPFILRVGIYFQDSPFVIAQPDAKAAAFEALTTHRPVLERLGVRCTFTPGSATRDDVAFGWSDQDLAEWLSGPSDNRDLVWPWDLRKGEPSDQQFRDVLAALLPVWLAWNSL